MNVIVLTLPKDGSYEPSTFRSLLASLWQAMSKGSLDHLFGAQEHISLELVGQSGQLQFQIWAASQALARLVRAQLRGHFPDVGIVSAESQVPQATAIAHTELRLGLERERPLRSFPRAEADPMRGLLAALADLAADAWGFLQILARPLLHPAFDTLPFEVILRLAAGGATPSLARTRLYALAAGFGPFGAENILRPGRVQMHAGRAVRLLAARRWPLLRLQRVVLTVEELGAIYHVPEARDIRHLPLSFTGARRLPPPSLPTAGNVRVGLVPQGSGEVPVTMATNDLLRHLAVFGATGTGKSTLLENMTIDLVRSGTGVSVVDPHGGLIADLLPRLPPERLEDVILVRLADVAYPVGLNVLSARPGHEFLVVDELVEICRRIYGAEYWGPVLDMVMRHAAYAALETGGTLVEMARLLDDDAYRERLLPRVQTPETRRFLERLSQIREGTREARVASTLNRLQRFLGTPFIRNIVGQRERNLDIRQVMDRRRILLVDLSGIGVGNARFLGSLVTLRYYQAALSREDTPEGERAPHVLILDESAWFISTTVGEMADQVRKFGLGLVLAGQRLGQLQPRETREAIFANVGSVVCFQMGEADEARYLERHLNTPGLTAEEIRSLGRYEVYAQILRDGLRQPAFWARTPPPPPAIEGTARRMDEVVRRSRERYGQPQEIVEREIAARTQGEIHATPEKRRR